MDFENFKEYLSIGSSSIAIVSFLFIIIKYIANYKYGKRCEYKFKVPYNFFTFNIEEVLIETAEYILILASIILLVILTTYDNKNNDFFNFVNPLFLFGSMFLYMVGTVGIIQDKLRNTVKGKHTFCCDVFKFCFIYVVIPAIITYINVKKIISITVLIKLMLIISLFCIIILLVSYFDYDNKKYKIIKEENGNFYAVITRYNSKFVIMDVVEDNNDYKIKEKGHYRLVEQISLLNVKYSIIKE